MVFYQQSAEAQKNMAPDDYAAARWDTAFGAGLTQVLTGAVLVAAAATLFSGDKQTSLASVGQVGEALTAALGPESGRLIFSLGVVGASLAAAIVASLALSWGVAEILGPRVGKHKGLFDSPWFFALYAACVVDSATLTRFSGDLVWLNIATQVANALLFPLVVGLLIVLAVKLPAPYRLRGVRLWLTVLIGASVAVAGLTGFFAGVL